MTQKECYGLLWKLLSCAAFAGINALVRYLTQHSPIGALPSNVILFYQNLFASLCILPWLNLSGIFNELTSKLLPWHLLRIISAVAGVSLWYMALKYLPLADSMALNFTGPIFTVIAAVILLNEQLTINRLVAIAVSIIGAFIIMHAQNNSPSLTLSIYAIYPLGSALLLAISKICTRKLTLAGANSKLLTAILIIMMTPCSLIPASLEWQQVSFNQLGYLAALGLLAAIAHFSFVKAYSNANVTFLTPIGFSKFFFGSILGYLLFKELPTNTVLIGMVFIFTSILLLQGSDNVKKEHRV